MSEENQILAYVAMFSATLVEIGFSPEGIGRPEQEFFSKKISV